MESESAYGSVTPFDALEVPTRVEVAPQPRRRRGAPLLFLALNALAGFAASTVFTPGLRMAVAHEVALGRHREKLPNLRATQPGAADEPMMLHASVSMANAEVSKLNGLLGAIVGALATLIIFPIALLCPCCLANPCCASMQLAATHGPSCCCMPALSGAAGGSLAALFSHG